MTVFYSYTQNGENLCFADIKNRERVTAKGGHEVPMRYALRQSSPKSLVQPPLLGGAQGG
jgi:hypothetical protein